MNKWLVAEMVGRAGKAWKGLRLQSEMAGWEGKVQSRPSLQRQGNTEREIFMAKGKMIRWMGSGRA